MLKRILIIVGILTVGIASFTLLNRFLKADTAVANKEELNMFILNTVTEKNS